jgi:hypothetical protein
VLAIRRFLVPLALLTGAAIGLSACNDPYDPGQRAAGGGLLGAGAGAATTPHPQPYYASPPPPPGDRY